MRFAKLALLPIVTLTACNGGSSTAPSSTAEPTPLFVLTGTVVEWTPQGQRPLGGALVWGQYHPRGNTIGQRPADESGRYQLSLAVIAGGGFQLMAFAPGYWQQCAQEITLGGETTQLDLPLIAETNLSSSKDSVPPSRPGFRVVTGLVYEPTSQGPRPVTNAPVWYDLGLEAGAGTRTDVQGRFLLCGLPQSRAVVIGVDSGGALPLTFSEVPPGADADIEIVVKQ